MPHDSHLGRDAAIGAGALGAGGLASHEYNKPSATERYDQGTGYGSSGVDVSDDYPKKIIPGSAGGGLPETSGHEVQNAPHGIRAHMHAGHMTSRTF